MTQKVMRAVNIATPGLAMALAASSMFTESSRPFPKVRTVALPAGKKRPRRKAKPHTLQGRMRRADKRRRKA